MARENKIYRGLNRHAEWGGLPALFLMFDLGVTFFTFLSFGIVAAIITATLLYTALRLFYEWEPHFFRILRITLSKTPRTSNRKQHGGDFYSA